MFDEIGPVNDRVADMLKQPLRRHAWREGGSAGWGGIPGKDRDALHGKKSGCRLRIFVSAPLPRIGLSGGAFNGHMAIFACYIRKNAEIATVKARPNSEKIFAGCCFSLTCSIWKREERYLTGDSPES